MSPHLITPLRWLTRIAGAVLLLIVIVIAVGEGFPNPFTLTLREQIWSFFLLSMVAGIVVAWKWEGAGSVMLIVGYSAFLIAESMQRHTLAVPGFLNYFLILGVLNVVLWKATKSSRAIQ